MPIFGKISAKASSLFWGTSHSAKKGRSQEAASSSGESGGSNVDGSESSGKLQRSKTSGLKTSGSRFGRSTQTVSSQKDSPVRAKASGLAAGSLQVLPGAASSASRDVMHSPCHNDSHKSDANSVATPQFSSQGLPQRSSAGNKSELLDSASQQPLPPEPSPNDAPVWGMQRLDDFELKRTIGTGSFGRVHLARNIHDNKFYALKVLGKAQIIEMNQVDHASNEKKIIRQLSNPFLVHCYSSFHDPQNLYFVLEYVYGGELFSYLRQSGRFENKVALFYSSEVVSAFEYMHNAKILYRDLKPENILINSDGHIKITDFGFAKYVPDVTWTLCGTPDYLAPEIIQSKAYNAAADWWSLGIFIYEMLAGYPPFYDENPIKLYEKILACKVTYSVNFAPEAIDLISKLLCLDLTKRYGNLKGGVNDIKNHPWYADVDWERVKRLEVSPPYIPKICREGDTSYFSTYAERSSPYNPNAADLYSSYFKDF